MGFLLSPGLSIADRYTIVGHLSSGAMGSVYVAEDADGERVAVKHLIDLNSERRFEIEARLLASLSHPRIARVREHVQDDNGSLLVMDLVDGRDLNHELIQRGSPGLPIEEALEYVRQACEAVQYVHDQQIVHRDIKPHNLILGSDGVVLVDFGVARDLDVEAGTVAIGTPRFMAPEILAGGVVSARSDVYGLAATLWMLICGEPPRYAESRRLSTVVEGVSAMIDEAVAAALDPLPDRRTASAAALARALGSELVEPGASLSASDAQPGDGAELMELIVRTAARVFEAGSCSIALIDPITGDLVYRAAWGVGAREIVGVRLAPGHGLAGAVVETGSPLAIADCRSDARFQASIASRVGYVPQTMLVVPLRCRGPVIGALSLLDRRDGIGFSAAHLERADLFAALAVAALPFAAQRYPTLVNDLSLPADSST